MPSNQYFYKKNIILHQTVNCLTRAVDSPKAAGVGSTSDRRRMHENQGAIGAEWDGI